MLEGRLKIIVTVWCIVSCLFSSMHFQYCYSCTAWLSENTVCTWTHRLLSILYCFHLIYYTILLRKAKQQYYLNGKQTNRNKVFWKGIPALSLLHQSALFSKHFNRVPPRCERLDNRLRSTLLNRGKGFLLQLFSVSYSLKYDTEFVSVVLIVNDMLTFCLAVLFRVVVFRSIRLNCSVIAVIPLIFENFPRKPLSKPFLFCIVALKKFPC